ncbi:uncharacterized protein LOC143196374 [Rhynchophorus ferrugineus]|uniref:uncharacterized protein LOC143196374 n=1 Tax=Rhynchophorus ferrugineus TaxID=354439 RepID=UPI003FCECD4F
MTCPVLSRCFDLTIPLFRPCGRYKKEYEIYRNGSKNIEVIFVGIQTAYFIFVTLPVIILFGLFGSIYTIIGFLQLLAVQIFQTLLWNTSFQVNMITYSIMDNEYLNTNEDKILVDLIHNESFQLHINQELISIHRRYIQLTRTFNLMMDKIKLQIIGVLFQSLAVMYPVYILLCDTSSNTLSFVSSVISVYILALILSLIVYDIGELYKTKCNEIYHSLTNTTWYNWNISNRKLYLIIQASLQQPAHLRIGINHELDRSHLLKLLSICVYIRMTCPVLSRCFNLTIALFCPCGRYKKEFEAYRSASKNIEVIFIGIQTAYFILVTLPVINNEHNTILLNYAKINYPSYQPVLFGLFASVFTIIGFLQLLAVQIFLTLLWNTSFQVNMIKYGIMDNEYLNISEDKILMDIIHKRTFQLRIKQKLISIHQRYIQLTRTFNLMMDEIKLQIIGVLFQSLAVMYPVYILLYDTSSNTLSFVSSVISVYILAIILSLVVYDIGELYKTKCNEIYDSLTNTTWYNWNNSNRTLYLIIQASLQQPALIRIGINHELDRSHLLKFLRLIYTLSTAAYHVTKKRD